MQNYGKQFNDEMSKTPSRPEKRRTRRKFVAPGQAAREEEEEGWWVLHKYKKWKIVAKVSNFIN